MTCIDEAKRKYDRLIRNGKDFDEIYETMRKEYSDIILTMLFPYPYIAECLECGYFCVKTLVYDEDFVEYLLSEPPNVKSDIWRYVTYHMTDAEDIYDEYIFTDSRYEFYIGDVSCTCIPLNIISDNIDDVELEEINEHPSLTEEFVKKHIVLKNWNSTRSIFDFDKLYKRNICSPDMELNILMVDGTHKVSVTSYFPLNALCDIFPTSDKKQSYYSIGSEEPLDKDMKFSELESNTIFICLEDE